MARGSAGTAHSPSFVQRNFSSNAGRTAGTGNRSFSNANLHSGGNPNSQFLGHNSVFGNQANMGAGKGNNWGWGNNWHGHHPGGGGGGGGGYGYGGYGFGFFPFFGYGLGWGLFGWPYYGYGNGGYGYGGYGGYGYGYNNGFVAADGAAGNPNGIDFGTLGEEAFRAGKYQDAANDFRHALIDDPTGGGLIMLLGQALFQTGNFNEAAGATQAAMNLLPVEKSGAAIENYKQLYGNVGDYTSQLKNLEKARDAKPDDPAIRFLLGFHFGYLGYPKQAVRELDKAVELQPRDPAARKLHDIFAAKIDAPLLGPPPEGAQQPGGPAQPEKPAPADVNKSTDKPQDTGAKG